VPIAPGEHRRQGAFLKEIEEAILAAQSTCVHSLKDVPTRSRGLSLCAYLGGDPRDALLSNSAAARVPAAGARVGTTSLAVPRR